MQNKKIKINTEQNLIVKVVAIKKKKQNKYYYQVVISYEYTILTTYFYKTDTNAK